VIGEEAIGELANGICIEQGGADRAQLSGPEHARVDQRFLHHAQGEPAGIDHAIAQRDCEHHSQAMVPIQRIDCRRVIEHRALGAGGKKFEQSAQRRHPRWRGGYCEQSALIAHPLALCGVEILVPLD
jgi:hypothetical protein